MRKLSTAALTVVVLSACADGSGRTFAPVVPASLGAVAHSAKISVVPPALDLLGTGTVSRRIVTVSEARYTGTFVESGSCKRVVSATPASGKGPAFKVTVVARGAGACALTFTDTNRNKATLRIGVTTAFVAIGAGAAPSGGKSVRIVLSSVDGKAPPFGIRKVVTAKLPACAAGCRIEAPQSPPGTDVYALTVFDAANGKGNKLASGSAIRKIVEAKKNAAVALLAGIPKYLIFGTVPGGTAGTPVVAPLPLSVQDADRDAISGAYATPVTVTDSDTSAIAQGSALSLDGGAPTRSVQLTSSAALTLNYGGLAMSPVTLSASAAGAASGQAQFSPALSSIHYTGPRNAGAPEIDLYNPASGQPGFSGTFTLSQAGWSGSGFEHGFTYALGGTNNNCSSYTIVPASGSDSPYTVSVAATHKAGTCTMTLSGATSNSTQPVILTYTVSGIGISAVHHPRADRH
jgi:hypothetical protein